MKFTGRVLISLGLVCLVLAPVLASADIEGIKTQIAQTKKDLKANQEKINKSDLNLPIKKSELESLKSELRKFNQTTVKQQEDYTKKIKEFNLKNKEYSKAKTQNQDLYREQARLEKLLLQLYDNKIDWQQKAKQKKHQFVSLVLSEACEQTACMSYKDLIVYDTSIQKVSGVLDENGTRQPPKYKQFWNWYPKNYTAVTIDPPPELLIRGAVITIVPTDFIWVEKRQTLQYDNYRFEYGGIRHDNKCLNSFVFANHTLIQKAINYYKSGCTNPGLVEKKIFMPATEFKLSDSVKYAEHQKWKNAAEKCKAKC